MLIYSSNNYLHGHELDGSYRLPCFVDIMYAYLHCRNFLSDTSRNRQRFRIPYIF